MTQGTQQSGGLVLGAGDVVHFGVATVPAGYLKKQTAYSVNEAVKFMPVEWLTTGLPLLVDWISWLQRVWLPVQRGALTGVGKVSLREALCNGYTNRLVALHRAAHWS